MLSQIDCSHSPCKLIPEIQELRASERRLYQRNTDIYATAFDCSANSQITKYFSAAEQDNMLPPSSRGEAQRSGFAAKNEEIPRPAQSSPRKRRGRSGKGNF